MRVYRRRKTPQYFFPFVLLLALGVLIVLVFQIGSSFFSSVKGDAVIYLAEGRAKLLPYGQTEWENTYHGVKVKLGDSVKTLNDSKAVISFYDGTLLRMDADTQLTLIDITKQGDSQQILLSLNHGQIWVNKPVKDGIVKKTDFVVQTNYASYAITGTIFDLNKTDTNETLIVMRGEVQSDILEYKDGKTNVLETVPVGIGQQLGLDDAVMKSFYNRESPSVLQAVDANFTASPWYVWNNSEDNNPTDFASGQHAVIIDNSATSEVTGNTSSANEPDVVNNNVPGAVNSAAPVITSPAQSQVDTSTGKLTISGTVAAGTQKVAIKQLLDGELSYETISLSKFVAGTTTFKYNLDPAFTNIKPGKNIYKVAAFDSKNKETDSDQLTVNYNEIANTTPTVTTISNGADVSSLTNATVVVSTVGGQTYSEGMNVSSSSFVISGTAKNAAKVFVDDYQLSKFQPGGSGWSYNVSESYGNLKAGSNSYHVYAEDGTGKRSPEVVVTINYTKPATAPVTDTTSTTSPSSSSSSSGSTVSSTGAAPVDGATLQD